MRAPSRPGGVAERMPAGNDSQDGHSMAVEEGEGIPAARRPPAASAQRRARRADVGMDAMSYPPRPTRPAPSSAPQLRRSDTAMGRVANFVGGRQAAGRLAVWLLVVALALAWTWRAHRDHK